MHLAIKVLLITLLCFSAFSLEGIGLNPIRPFHLNQGKLTSYLFSISPQEQILTKAKLKVTFPFQFDHSQLAANLECMAKSNSYNWKYVRCQYYIDSVIVTLETIKNENTQVLISKPLNPTIYSMSSYFSICLMYDNAITTCNKQFGKVIFSSPPINTISSPSDPSVTSLTSSTAGQSSTYQFKFTLGSTYSIGNTLRIKFPVGFTTTSSPICQMSGTFNQVIKTFVWPDNRSIQCQSINKTISSNQVLKIIGIYNPKYTGTFGNTQDGFTLQLLKETTTIVLQQIYIKNQVTILPGTLVGRIQQQNNFIKSKSKYTFYLNIQNSLTYGNYIQIRFDKTWTLYSGQCSVITGLSMGTNHLSCINSTDSTYTYLNISNFLSATVSNQIVISIFVGSPLGTGDYTVQTITSNQFGVMDKMLSKVTLNSTYGTLEMLSINAITANAKVAVGATGPLQMTFFLNYPLPQTNVLTYGKLILYIYPQILLPPPLINGVLKCYFFNNIPAKTCLWDTSTNPSYTLVTINTPETMSFQYSQIPITITTQGAVNDSMIGITIADKVTRYRFELNAFTQENDTTPTEVYYTEYIADPILLPLTTYSLTNYINQYTHLRFEFVGPYDFLDITQNLRIKIQFLNTGAWANNLGYEANKIYKNYPCVFSENLGTNTDNYLSDIMCDLYTFLDGPHASLTDSAQRGPYIIVYGFNNSILQLSNYRLEVGRFLISQSANIQASLRFSILQETPDMLTKYIELYYNEFSAFTTISTVKATLTNQFTTSMNTSQINLLSVHTNSYSVSTNGWAIIYDYDQSSTESFANIMYKCTTSNWCVKLGYPLNWIIEYHSTANFPTSITSIITTTNGKYADTFTGLVRVFGTDMQIIYKSSYTYIYTPNGLNNYEFWLQETYLYKGMEQYYNVYFRPDTTLPSGCFIRLTLGSGFKFGVTPYCSSSQLVLIDSKIGLLCNLQNSQSTLKIYNLNGLTANTNYQIRLRIASELTTTTGASYRPSVTIKTYLTTSIDTSVVDQLNSLSMNSSETNYYNNPTTFQIDNPRTIYDIPVVQYVGQFLIKFTPSASAVTSSKIRVILNNHPWNGGIWTTPNNALTDALVCLLNGKRVACTFTLAPLNILMDVQPAGIVSGTTNYISFNTQYIASQNGIKHPLYAGSYMSNIYFYDNSMVQIQSNSFTHRVKARKLQNFRVLSTCHDIGVQNMFRINIQINDSIPVNSYTNGGTYSRIFIEFPTVDSLGNRLFADDLGGYTKTGQYVGCYFNTFDSSAYVSAVTSYMKCRLIKSQVYGDPARVQIINHNYFSSSYPYMRVYIAKIFNPPIAVTSVPISIRIQHVTVSNNNVQDIYYDTYDTFMNSQAPTPVANNTRNARGNSFQGSRNINDIAYMYLDIIKVGSVGITSGQGFYYVLDTTDSFKPRNRQANPSLYCHSSYFYECMFFPEINYLIIWSFSTNYYVSMDVYFAPAISQVTTTMTARIWQNGRFMGFDVMSYLPANWNQLRGTILSQSFSTVGSSNNRQIGRRKQQMQVSFVLQNIVPAGGTVQIVWPSGVPAAYPHCRSMTNLGSALTASSQLYNGQIGCMVQNTRTWVITSFQALSAGATIIINGQIDLPNSSGYLGSGQIITYNNTHSTDIRTNGFIIDYVNDANFDVQIVNSNSWNVDSEITVWETLPLRIGYTGPLQFKFQLASDLIGPKSGRISVVVNKRSTINLLTGFTYVNKKYVCKIVQISNNQQTGCSVQSVIDTTTTGTQNIKFIMFTSSTLSSANKYILTLTSQTGAQPEGLVFPSQPGKYQTSISFDVTGSGTYNIYNNLYLDVFGTPFTLLKVQAWVTIPGDPNLVWIQLTPTTTIQTSQQIVIEFPTKSSAGATLFSNDLGTGLIDGSLIPVDVIDGDFDNTFMKCRLFYGDQTNSKNAKVVCGSFTQAITSSKLLFFAFKIVNPSISVQVSIPLFIYSQQIGQTYRTNFNVHQNAIFINNDLYTNNYEGDIYSSSSTLQTDNSYIDLITRNNWNLQVGSAYVLYFNFPIRKNGKVTNGCTYPGSSIYGHAYYHWNLWTVVCTVTSATIGVPAWYNTTQGNTRNLRISGFYTPWYYLKASQQVIITYGYRYDWKISSRGQLTDGYPNESPKIGTSPTFLMTPLHQSSPKYLGSRDDYIFEIIYSTASLVDISYTKLIAIIIPNSNSIDFVLKGQDCVQAINSQIQVQQCWIDTGSRVIWIRPVIKTSYTNNMKIRIQTRNLAIQNPISNSSFDMSLFLVKYYSWENVTQSSITLSPLSNNNYCFLMINNIASSAISFSANPTSYPTQSFDYIYYPHQRYYEDTPFNSLSQRAPFEMIFIPHANFPLVSGNNLHTIKITYPSSFGDYDMFTIRDLQVFRPVCYLNNNRISRCTVNTASNYIIMNFQFALTLQTKYHIKISLIDPRNPDVNGFTSAAAVSNLLVQYQINPSNTIYYMQTDQFPSLFTLPSGISTGPFRSIIDGSVQYGHAVPSALNVINLKLTFNRTDITGLVFQIPLFDAAGLSLYPSNFANAFFTLQNGATYPCGNHGLNAGGNVKCFILNGDNTQNGIPTRIIMTDFTYVSQMNCRFLFYNPDQTSSNYPYFSINVKAYGGTKSANNLYGDKYMGQWTFADIFQVVSASTVIGNTVYTRGSYKVPSKSPWRNLTTDYVFSRNQQIGAGRMSIAQVKLYDSTLSYTDKSVCEATLGSGNDYDDLIEYTLISGVNSYKYAFFVRTWASTTNISYTTNQGWDLTYLKCKFYALSHIGYFFFSDSSIQIATNQWSTSHQGTYGSITAPTVIYFDQTYRFADGTDTYFVIQIDFTATINSISNFEFRKGDSMLLKITLSNNYWTSIDQCSLLGGIISTSATQLATCAYASTDTLLISNIAGFEDDPLLDVSTNKRVKLMFRGTALAYLYSGDYPTRYVYSYLYANQDAYNNGYQPIFAQTSTQINNCYYANSVCYYAHGPSNSGNFYFDSLSDTSFRVAFKPYTGKSYGDSLYDHYFKLQFSTFGFGSGCSISSIVAEISSSKTPGSGVNNTIDPDSSWCDDHRIHFSWTTNRNFADIWGGQGLASDNDWSTSQYIIVYIILSPGTSKDLPVYHHEYLFMTGSYNYVYNGGSYVDLIRAVSYLPTQSLATSATFSTISTNRGGVTQLMLQVKGLNMAIGSANTNYLLLAQFLATSSWTSANDPFKSYTNTLNNDEPIDCKCLSGIGPLSSSTTSPFVNAKCRRRLPTTSFNNFAILIDSPASLNNDIRCYFPQFYIFAGMSFNSQVKVIYGDSYPPDLIGSNQYGSLLRITTNTLTFSGSSPSMSLSGFSSFGQTVDIYTNAVNVGSKYTSIYNLTANWASSYSTPYVYINFRKAGPIPVFSFCSDSNVYYECRVYTSYINLIVAKLKSTGVNNLSMTQGTQDLYYPSSQFSDSALFGAIMYVGTGDWVRSTTFARTQSKLAPISTNSFLVMSDKYGSNRYGYDTNLLISMSTNGQTLYNNFKTGSKIQISFSGITQKSSCQVWVQNQPSIQLICVVSTNLITIYSLFFDYTPSNNIFVSLGIINPNSASNTFNMKMYNYYYSGSRYSLVISTSTTYSVDTSYFSNTKQSKSRVIMYPFKSRQSMVSNSPLRFRFKLSASPGAITYAGNGRLSIVNNQFQYSSKFLCYFKQYTSYTNMDQQTQYQYYQAATCSSSSTTLTILPAKTMTINPAYYYEFIAMPIGITVAGCAVVGYGCQTQTGFHQDNFQNINIIAYQYWVSGQTPVVANQQVNKRYAYQGSTMIGLQYIYVLSIKPNQQTSLYLAFNLNFTSTNTYPNHYLQITFWDMPSSSFTGYVNNDIIPCQLSTNFLSINNRQAPQCRLGYVQTTNNIVKVRIQNFGNIAVGNYWVSFDDFVLPILSSSDTTQKYDISIGFFGPSNLKYENNFKQIFIMDGTNTNSVSSSSFTFTNPTIRSYGSLTTGVVSFTWPFTTTTSGYQSKIAINMNGGYSQCWDNVDSLTFSQSGVGTYLILWVNKKLNKFVFKIPNKGNGVATTLNINNLRNPYPYHQSVYNANSTNVQINFYQSFYLQTRQVFTQPLFSYYQMNPAIIFVNQNLPTNTLDNSVTSLKTAPGGLSKLILSLQFGQTVSNIILRQLDVIDITFTSGLTYIDRCKVMRNSSQYVNTQITCQTYYDNSNWHVKIYEVSKSQLDVGWWIQIWGTYTSATLSYKFQIMPYNSVVQYQSNYTTSLSNFYLATNSIPTSLSWMNNKYVPGFYQTQVKMLQANTGVYTPYFRFRFTVPASFDGAYSDYITISLPSNSGSQPFRSKTSTTNLFCNFLPATSVQRDFSIGLYSQCTLIDSGSYLYFRVQYIRGGLSQGQDYLLQITQQNIIASSFYLPTIPQRDQISLYLWRNESGTAYGHSDAFYIRTYRYFSQASILHTTTTVSDYDTLTITYTPQGSFSAGSSNRQMVLRLSVYSRYLSYDGGISAIYSADGVTIQSGAQFSEVVSNPNTNQVTTVKFHQYGSSYINHLQISLAKQSAYTSGTQYTWRIPLLKNPSTAFVSLSYNLTLVEYATSTGYQNIFNKYQIINEYYTQPDTSTSFVTSITNNLRNVQLTSGVDLSIDLSGYSLAQWDSAIFKLDNSKLGLLQNFANCNDTSNYNYYYFRYINMVLAQKKTVNSITNIGIGAVSGSLNYQSTFAFSWVKVFDSSNVQEMTNPKTLKYSIPSTLTLRPLTTYASSSLTVNQGIQVQSSQVMYTLVVRAPIVPQGGQIRVMFDSTKFSTNLLSRCRVGAGFTKSANQKIVLRCYRGLDGFIISGFGAIAASTDLTIYFYLKSLVSVSASGLWVDMFGIYRDNSTRLANATIRDLTHATTTYPTSIGRVEQMIQPYYTSINSVNYYYQIEGSFTLRSAALNNSLDRIYLTDPFTIYGTRRLLVKKNSSLVTGWTQLDYSSCSGSSCVYYLPTSYSIDLALNPNQQYIWRYTSYNWASGNNQGQAGFLIDSYGSNRFVLSGYDGNGGNYTDQNYFQFVSQDRPSVLTIQNRYPAAGQQTILDFTFSVDVDVNAGAQFQFTFDTNNLLLDMFQNDVQGASVINGQTYRYLDCRQWSTNSNISNSRLVCILYFGNRQAVGGPTPARLSITLGNYIDGYPSANTMRFLVSNVKNPINSGMNVGVQMKLYTPCQNVLNQKCPVYSARGYYVTSSGTQNTPANAATFSSNSWVVLDTLLTHTFTIPLASQITTSDVIYIIYPQNFVGLMPTDCTASGYTCYSFPTRRWIALYPSGTKTGTISIGVYHMTNGYYSQAYSQNFKITVARSGSLGDVYNALQTAFTPITSLITMTISATQTPQIWLRNYANTAIFQINNIFMDNRIKAIYIQAPADISQWTDTYCNATITGTLSNTYPLRFICSVFADNPRFLIITRQSSQMTNYVGAWASATIRVHAQFTIVDFISGQPILYNTNANNSGLFYAYGSVNTSSQNQIYYLSKTSQTVLISQHQVPIISQITFDQKSFAHRVGTVNSKQVFYLLLKPIPNIAISKMVFTVPNEFDYPGVFSHDNCYMLGRTKEPQNSCQQSRQAGQTLITLSPSNYDQDVRIIQLGSKLTANWFTSPSLPGDFYNMTVELYSGDNLLLQKQTINISPVYGEYFDIPSIVLQNIKQANLVQSVYDLSFITGTLQIPPGGVTTATKQTSQLQFIFENYNAAIAANVFSNDLKTGLAQGDEVGCVFFGGFVALQNQRLRCIIYLGKNSTDKPIIKVLGYDFINPGTTLNISFAGIQSLPQINVNTISIAVVIYYHDEKDSSTYLYIPTPVRTVPTNATSTQVDRTFNLSGWSWGFNSSFSGVNVVLKPSQFQFSLVIPYTGNYSGWVYSSSGQQHSFILIKFSPKFLIDPYNAQNITSGQCVSLFVYYATGIIRCHHTRSMSGYYWTFTFTNFPTSAYTILNQAVKVSIQIYDQYRFVAGTKTNPNALTRTVQKCTLFNFGVLSVSSLNGGQIGVSYLFSIKTNHYIPSDGAISITIPDSYGNMVTNNATCTLIGFEATNVYCAIYTPSRIDIYLNGSQLDQNASYSIRVSNLQNPNSNSSSLIFYVSSYFDNSIYKARKICQNQITPPAINVKAIRACTLSWQPNYSNQGFNATYIFYVSCSDQFRGDSILYIKLPTEFNSKNKVSSLYCTSFESSTLINNLCTLSIINGSFVLSTQLDATSQSSLSIITNLINPSNNTYSASANIMSKGVLYASAPPQTMKILSNSYQLGSTKDVFLMNNPKEAGLMATYVFKIAPISSFDPANMGITFPKNFFLSQADLIVGLACTSTNNLFDALNYDNIQKIINNISSVAGVSLTAYPTFSVLANSIYLSNISGVLNSSQWTYLFVRGVKNPSKFESLNFTISYYVETVQYKALRWLYSYPLTYYISTPPDYLTIKSVSVSDYDILYPSVYTFILSSTSNIAIANKKLSYVIVLPSFYQSTLWANTAPKCKFSLLSTNSTCYSYESQIIITETFATNQTSLTITIDNILNPALETYCNTTDVTLLGQTFFIIRIIDVQSDAFLFQSSAVVDGSNCLKFYATRIPITLQYSLIMVAGIAYNISYGLTKPASNLKINAYIENQNGFTFSPSMVEFNDYYTLSNSTTLYLRSDINPGVYTIKFNKYESDVKTYFRNILPITITVIKATQSTIAMPTISINSFTQSTVGYPVSIPVSFSLPSSTEMTLFMTILEQSNQTLAQYSPHLKNFTIQPRVINIQPQSSNYSFIVTQMQRVVPPPLTLSFKLTSLYPIIHNLTTSKMYLCFDQDPRYNVLYPPLRIKLTPYLQSCNSKDVGKNITNIFVSSDTSNSSANKVLPKIINVTSTSVSSTSINIQVSVDSKSTIYYLNQKDGYPIITDKAVIKSGDTTIGLASSVTSSPMNVYSSSVSQINYLAQFTISNLTSTTKFNVFLFAQSNLGQSEIYTFSFETTSLSKGVKMILVLTDIVQPLNIVQALVRIMRISPLRVKVLTSVHDLLNIQNSVNQYKNTPKYNYQVVIAPDALNDIISPLNLVKNFITNSSNLQLLKKQIPQWDSSSTTDYFEIKPIKPRITQMPKPVKINTYNCTFSIKMWEQANIYAVLIQRPQKAKNTLTLVDQVITPKRVSSLTITEQKLVPSSNQIRNGVNVNNIAVSKYRKFYSATDQNGAGFIFFDDLTPGSIYDMYITASSVLPFEPSYLWSDNEVITLKLTILYSQAVHNQQINTQQLRKYKPGLANAIQNFLRKQTKKDQLQNSNN